MTQEEMLNLKKGDKVRTVKEIHWYGDAPAVPADTPGEVVRIARYGLGIYVDFPQQYGSLWFVKSYQVEKDKDG